MDTIDHHFVVKRTELGMEMIEADQEYTPGQLPYAGIEYRTRTRDHNHDNVM